MLNSLLNSQLNGRSQAVSELRCELLSVVRCESSRLLREELQRGQGLRLREVEERLQALEAPLPEGETDVQQALLALRREALQSNLENQTEMLKMKKEVEITEQRCLQLEEKVMRPQSAEADQGDYTKTKVFGI